MARRTEVYSLECRWCLQSLEIPAGPSSKRETRFCPHCGTRLVIEFRPAVEVPHADRG